MALAADVQKQFHEQHADGDFIRFAVPIASRRIALELAWLVSRYGGDMIFAV
jgi:hypothetical protein